MTNDVGKYRKLYVRLWRHPGFVGLSDAEKTLAIYLLTGPQTNRIGLSVLSVATAAEDLGTVPQTLSKRLETVCQTFGWHFHSATRVLYIPSWWRWNEPANVNVMRGNLKDLHEIPPSPLVEAFANNTTYVPNVADKNGQTVLDTFIEGLAGRLPNRLPNQKQYQDQNQKEKQKPSALRAVAANERGQDEPEIPEVVRTVARETIAFYNVSGTNDGTTGDEHIDGFWQFWNRTQSGSRGAFNPDTKQIKRALYDAMLERRSA